MDHHIVPHIDAAMGHARRVIGAHKEHQIAGFRVAGMKGQDADMDEIYAKFGVDYDLLSTLMTRETDDEGHLRIRWGEQMIA